MERWRSQMEHWRWHGQVELQRFKSSARVDFLKTAIIDKLLFENEAWEQLDSGLSENQAFPVDSREG